MLLPTARGVRALRGLALVAAFTCAAPALAATPVFVDDDGICAGLTPCFTTIQAGVNNAGPPPAVVNVFPGDYDSVDIGLMGSAIGGSTGDLTLRTVDADGDPALGTAQISAATGPALFNTAVPFMGDVSIQGFTVISPDDDGIDLGSVQGTVDLRGVVSDDNAAGGFRATIGDGDLLIHDSSFSGNDGGDGLVITVEGDLEIERVDANGNSSDGVFATVGGSVRILESSFDDNQAGDGLILTAAGRLDIEGSSFDRNDSDGAFVTVGADVSIRQSTFDDNKSGDGLILTADGGLDVDTASFARNSSDGAFVTLNGSARIRRAAFDDNKTGDGLILTADGDLDVEGSSFDRNSSDGAFVSLGGNARIHQSTFDDNKSGDGLILTADGDLDIERSSFDRNASDGAFINVDGRASIRDSSFSGNETGSGLILTAAHLDAARIVASDNAGSGSIARVASALVVGSRFERNGNAGVLLNATESSGSYVLRCSDIAGNLDGLVVTSEVTVIAEKNFWGDPSGPTHPSNPEGTGDTIRDAASGAAGTVDFIPFLTGPASESGECVARPAPALDWAGLAILALALLVLPARRLMH